MMDAEACKYAKSHKTVHFKWVNCMLCKVQFNKMVLKSAFQFILSFYKARGTSL